MNSHTHRPCDRLQALLETAENEETIATLIAAHVAACPECDRAEHAIEELAARLRGTTADTLPPAVEGRLMARLCGSIKDAATSPQG